ncbi:hypothetical protein BU24DRAFT_423056 [Aaosphaeria arxii CBS 175.79]|uniref:Sacsin/Nov domain-containing protein n=1 Tax=Aaosphaeria arxii CBS 175.79 TaxID=1450172 RepID=A0A6A5XUQ0_9PLEO|nr:uncharacterized protein BU24DRAFT_423056 [Aaosphaeria arxii CBS 175.79]KAF2016683.1 hypothetical protein BU24DRAFT_423056 [Aaosphaeria arxii CBS 175.79]
MATMDFSRLRNQTMADGLDSEVTVNTRALIDKVLARYSSEHTTLRELIQNASDAGATTVQIKFETDPSLEVPAPQGSNRAHLLRHIIQHHTLKRLVVSNNGQPFTAADWSRLKSIADGNPDETKIGAFGVGFYSVFADCDEPFVVSGDRTMAFYWKGNTLSTKVSNVPSDHQSTNTIFSLDYRQANPASPSYSPSKVTSLPSLCQFLATSLTFVGLSSIELYLDDFKIVALSKKISPPSEISIPKGLKTDTEGGLMRVSRITQQHSQIDAEWSNVIATAQAPPKRAAELVQAEMRNAGTTLKSFFSKFSSASSQQSKSSKPTPTVEKSFNSEEITGESKGTIFLQVCTVEVETRVTKKFSAEIERATKKPPPRKTRIALLTSPYHDPSESLSTGSGNTAELSDKIFAEVLPTKAGRIFIGFPTAQTTGFLAHISAPSLIPTVERENVDMNARYISTWNVELLRVAGLACRISYMTEMGEVQAKLGNKTVESLIPQAAYIFKRYTATSSHPSTSLGETVEEAFWNCSKERSIEILSSKGLMPSKQVRMPAETLSFLGEVPMVPQELAKEAVTFMINMHQRGFISELTMADIRHGLESRALTEEELIEFLKWSGAKLENRELDMAASRSLFEITIANVDVKPEENSGKILALGDIITYVNAAKISPTMPIPPDTIPFAISKVVPVNQLRMFGWNELSIVQWIRFMTSPNQLREFTTSEQLASQVLSLTAKTWDQLDPSSREAVVGILTPHPIMPTKMGMRRPAESYFPTVKLFDDLPTVKQFPGSKERFLQALGVRKTIDLPMVFDRMRNVDSAQSSEKSTWNHADLIRYFASVIEEIPKKDLDRLQQTPFLPGEGASVKQGQLFKAQDLFAPEQSILSLGLTQVKLPFEYKASSREGQFLLRLGLKQWPDAITVAKILHRAGQAKDQSLWILAMEYYLQNFHRNGYAAEYKHVAALTLPILPTSQAPFPTLVAPFQCFTNENARHLGYAILRADLRMHADKFGVRADPDIKDCVQRLLRSPPKTKVDADQQYSYLGTRATELDQHRTLVQEMSVAHIVPIFRPYYLDASCCGFEDRTRRQTGKTELRVHHYDPPETVFVGRDQDWKGILDYVHYSPEATAFLLKVGAKHEPSSIDLAHLLCRAPSRFLNTIGQDRYLGLLRKLAEHAGDLFRDKELSKKLITSRILLGYRDIKNSNNTAPAEEDDLDDFQELDMQREWSLNQATEVVIIDDVNYLTRFRDFIISAPQEEQLEEFYARFGVKKISELVKADRRIGVMVRDQTPATKLRKDILERARLFLHEYERDASSRSIRHDAKWLSSNLAVQCVSDISIRYSLAERNIATSTGKTAAIVKIRGTGILLSITPRYDVYEVSAELVKILIQRPKQNDTIALERILTEPLRRLQEKGINVERILRKREIEARIAKQQEMEREQEEQQRLAEQAKHARLNPPPPQEPEPEPEPETKQRPGTPEHKMPGAFGSPDNKSMEIAENHQNTSNKSVLNDWAKKLGFRNTPSAPTTTDGPQINRDISATKSNIANAIKECRPTNMEAINSKHHQDPTELDKGGYCNGEQWENIHKAFSIPYSGRHVDVYFGKHQSETPQDLQTPLTSFLPLIFGLTSIFGVNPAAVNIFLDSNSNTVAFNLSGSLFFNLAWYRSLHEKGCNTLEGRYTALDSWFFTYCHELAHNLVGDHNARHSWYQQQIAIEYSQKYRAALSGFVQGLLADKS